MSNHLMLFTVGPVQSFIAQARKTQDLWAGSYLLSYLINQSMNQLVKIGVPKDDIIFPDAHSPLQDEIASLPNRILFFTTDPEKAAKELNDVVNDTFKGICTFAFEKLKKRFKNKEFVDLIPRQAKGFITTSWVAVPYTNGSDYAKEYEALEFLLRSRKNIKDFGPIEESGIKCPVCGEREAIHLENQNKKQEVLSLWREVSNNIPKINANETLCTVCLGKRFFPDYVRHLKDDKPKDLGMVNFPSTAEVASSRFKYSLIQDKKYRKLEDIIFLLFAATGQSGKLLPKNRAEYAKYDDPDEVTDGHWLFLENYSKREFKSTLFDDIDSDKFLKAGDNLKEYFKENKLAKISKSYAVFFMDGDSMKDKISQIKNRHDHQAFTRAMAEFATNDVKRIVETEHLGKVIYAGGDDVAALVNLNDLLPVLDKLRTTFLEKMRGKIEFISDPFTMSAGAAVAHYKSPFSLVLEYARFSEEQAKNFNDGNGHSKNALGITVTTHSGVNRYAVVPWEYDSGKPVVGLINELMGFISDQVISKNFIYVLKSEFELLSQAKAGNEKDDQIFKTELKRTLKRATMNKDRVEEVNNLGDKLYRFYEHSFGHDQAKFISFLEVCNALSQEIQK